MPDVIRGALVAPIDAEKPSRPGASGNHVDRFHSDAVAVRAFSREVATLPTSTATRRFLRFPSGGLRSRAAGRITHPLGRVSLIMYTHCDR